MKSSSSIRWVNNTLRRLRRIQLKTSVQRLEERGYEIHISDEALKLLSENGYDPVYGARPLNVLSSSRSKPAGTANTVW